MMNKPLFLVFMSVLCTGLVYIAVGLPLAVLPGWVNHDLHFSPVVAGLAISVQYIATIVSRGLVGPMADTAGPRRSILIGFACCLASGVVGIVAAYGQSMPSLALGVLFLSRIMLGFGESMVGTSAIAWGIGRTGPEHIARIISWNGIATYAGIALGAPIGVALFATGGMPAIGFALAIVGVAGFAMVWPQSATAIIPAPRMPFTAVFARVFPYGMALALGAIGFGVISAFIALYYGDHGWSGAWVALSAFGGAFVLARLIFVDSIARHGGIKIAAIFLVIETVGLITVWLAPVPALAVVGASVTGFGFALIFPALGMIVVDLVPPQNRGAAIGAYSMFTDISLCVTGPIAGFLVARASYPTPFLFGGVAALLGCGVVLGLGAMTKPNKADRERNTTARQA